MPDFFISSKFLLEIKNIATPIEEWNDIINKNEFVVNVKYKHKVAVLRIGHKRYKKSKREDWKP